MFDLPIERIRIRSTATPDRANGFGGAGSRSIFVGGAAVRSRRRTPSRMRRTSPAGARSRAIDIEYRAGRFGIAGTDRGIIGLFALAARRNAHRASRPGGASVTAPSWPNACHVRVEIDPETGS